MTRFLVKLAIFGLAAWLIGKGISCCVGSALSATEHQTVGRAL